ncbi:hypothetical protein ART_4159 [Arthrobacter sp. PAMC 25486]|nr:hypothetical protein ART_4159 [Arthrobacter sp. PAMC 25486]
MRWQWTVLVCHDGAMDTDILIIGGGIAGLSLAWALAPSRRVVLVEAEEELAHHTSSRSARQMQPNYGPPVIRELTLRSIALVQEISASLPEPILRPRPLLTLGSHAEVAALVAQHPALVALDHAETLQLSPDLRPGGFTAAALDDSAMEVDVPALLEFYRSQAQAAGAVVLTAAPVTAAEASPGSFTGSFTLMAGQHRITANVVVNAAGAWAEPVAAIFGAQTKNLVPYRRSVAIVSTASPVNPAGPMVEPADESYYYRPDGGHLLISPCESVPAEPGDAQVLDADITKLIHRIDAVTTLAITGVVRAWTGLRTEAPDGVPVAGFDAAVPNFFWLAGQGGYGIQTSAALATLAAQLIAGTVPAKDAPWAAALSPQRAGLQGSGRH